MFAVASDGPLAAGMATNRTLTWLGHSTFRLDTPGGKRIYIDPFLNGNPKCPEAEREPERVDVIAITHGHGDHVGDTIALAAKFGCTVVAPVELADWLARQGVEDVRDPNKGGTVDVDGVKVTLTHAHHSSSTNDGTYAGEPCGLVVELEDGFKVYFAGDTNVFGDMALIARIYAARRRGAADRRPLHDGSAGGGRRARAARSEAVRPVPLRHVPGADGNARAAARARAGRRGRSRPSREARSSCERALVRRDRRRVPELALEGVGSTSRARSCCDDVRDERLLRDGARAGHAGRRARGDRRRRSKAALARPGGGVRPRPDRRSWSSSTSRS